MIIRWSALLGAGVTVLGTALGLLYPTALSNGADGPRWEAVTATVPAGDKVRIEARLVDGSGGPVAGPLTVRSVRLDMAPDGMPTMVAPVRTVGDPVDGVVALEADLAMAGRWALTLNADLDGYPLPVEGVVVLTADPAGPATTAESGDRSIAYYRNPMGLPDTSPTPKKDSMGMDYIPVYADELEGDPGTVRLTAQKIQRSGVRTAAVERHRLERVIRGLGRVAADEARVARLTAKFEGFVEELLVPVTGTRVEVGQPIARVWIESGEILQKQSDLLLALRDGSGIGRAEANLRLFGIPDMAIADIRRGRQAVRSILLTATSPGTVMQKPAVTGMRFTPGEPLFEVVDLSTVWVIAEVAERDIAALCDGQRAIITLNAEPDRPIEGRVALVYPEVNQATRTVAVRIEVPNPDGALRLGQYAEVEIASELTPDPVVAVPDSAIVDAGSRRVAFVAKEDGVFEPRALVLGARADGLVEVRDGLVEGERIVVTGNFLIDSESNLRAALAAFGASGGAP